MIQPLTRKENNPYYIWIEENQDYEYASIFENKIAEY